MRKPKIPKPEPPDLVLEYVDPADPDVPHPQNSVAKRASAKVSHYLANRYEWTRRLGGLVPDDHGKAYWRCAECFKIWDTNAMAKECCHGFVAQVQICIACLNKHNQRYRIGECQCPPRT